MAYLPVCMEGRGDFSIMAILPVDVIKTLLYVINIINRQTKCGPKGNVSRIILIYYRDDT